MRILQVTLLFTILFIAHGGCKPSKNEVDYQGDGDDYENTDDNTDPGNPETSEANSPDPHILTRSQKLLVRLGDTVHLPCNVSNDHDVAVIWKKGATLLYHGDFPDTTEPHRITRQNDNSLTIHNFKDSDISDEYVCEITSETSEQVVHSVRTKKNIFLLPSETVIVSEKNKSITLACQVNWEPKPLVKWTYEGKPISSDNSSTDGSSLTINNPSESKTGRYQCLIESSHPEVKSIHVIGPHAPKIGVENEIVHTGIHMDAELTCQVDAHPKAIVTWSKDGEKITNRIQRENEDSHQIKIKHTLVFNRVEKSDFGKYTCEASNGIGKAAGRIELTGAPTVAKFNGMETTKEGTVAILKWELQSISPIIKHELKYRPKGDKDWKIVYPGASDDGTGNVFKISYPLEGLKAGDYEAILISQNEFGWSPSPSKPAEFFGEIVTAEPEIGGSKSGASSSSFTQSLLLLRSLILAGSLTVFTRYL